MKRLKAIDIGLMPFDYVYSLQKKIAGEIRFNGEYDCILLTEHPNIFTIGRSGSRENILVDENFLMENSIQVAETDRGGDITYHGPGQLVTYPIFDLNRHAKDVGLFIRNLEKVLEATLAEYGLTAEGNKGYTGLWFNGKKIGFVGIAIRKWVAYHGISINANVDLKYFSMIRACGIDNIEVSSIHEILNRCIELDELKEIVIQKFSEVFDFDYTIRCCKDACVAEEEVLK